MEAGRRLAALCFLIAGSLPAAAEDLPSNRGLTLIVPAAAGGPVDAAARVVRDVASRTLGRQISVVNIGGAGGNIGAATVARAEPDGLTWLLTADTLFTVNPHIYADMGFNAQRDLTIVASIAHSALVLSVNARNVAAKTLDDLISQSRKKPVTFASSGAGSPAHLAFEYLRMASGLNGVHVPYRGAAPALQDLSAGYVDAAFIGATSVIPLIRAGELRALAVSTDSRIPALGDVPSAREAGIPGFDAKFKLLLIVRPGTPSAIRASVLHAVKMALEEPKAAQQLRDLSVEPAFEEGDSLDGWIASARLKWGKVIGASRAIQPD